VEHIKAHFILRATLPLVIVLMDMKIIQLILKITKKNLYKNNSVFPCGNTFSQHKIAL